MCRRLEIIGIHNLSHQHFLGNDLSTLSAQVPGMLCIYDINLNVRQSIPSVAFQDTNIGYASNQ